MTPETKKRIEDEVKKMQISSLTEEELLIIREYIADLGNAAKTLNYEEASEIYYKCCLLSKELWHHDYGDCPYPNEDIFSPHGEFYWILFSEAVQMENLKAELRALEESREQYNVPPEATVFELDQAPAEHYLSWEAFFSTQMDIEERITELLNLAVNKIRTAHN